MATADEILMAMEEETEAGAEERVLVIDNDLRSITVPGDIGNLGVEGDDDVKRLNFRMPRMYGEFDLSVFSVRVAYVNANKEGDAYLVNDVEHDENTITFSWLAGKKALKYKGETSFAVNLRRVVGGVVVQRFNTEPAKLPVLDGIDADTTEEEETKARDLLAQILDEIGERETQAIENIEKKTKEVLDSIASENAIAELRSGKANAIEDHSAKADSHQLYAQKAPMQVTIHGTAEGVSEAWVRTCGKNLFSASWELGQIDNNTGELGSSDSRARTASAIPVIAGKTYSLWRNKTEGNCIPRYFDNPDMDSSGYLGRGTLTSFMAEGAANRTFVGGGGLVADGTIVYLALTNTLSPVVDAKYTLVESGEALTEYEPYTENRVEVTMDAPLMEGDTHSVELPALGTMPDNVMGSAQTSVVYAHDTKHYIDEKFAALSAALIGG